MSKILALGRQRQKDSEFEVSLGYTTRSWGWRKKREADGKGVEKWK